MAAINTSPPRKRGKRGRRLAKNTTAGTELGPVSVTCLFCGSEETEEDVVGKLLTRSNVSVHYFCMLLSSGLCQRGQPDKDGLYGFLVKDIQREINRGKKLVCQFCKNKGATIGCSVKSCRASFHLRCGRINGSLHQFYGCYSSFCPTHRPRQASLTSDRLAFFGTANSTCAICICSVEARASNETLRSPCCRSSWFHRNCIQRLASTAGLHYFKCPLCNNKDVFQEEMLEFGIYIPDQDAAWELDPNAYQELLERYNRCDAVKCLCKQGREYSKDLSKWEISLCVSCGSQGCHIQCGNLPSHDYDWVCPDCEIISQRVASESKGTKGKKSGRGKGPKKAGLKSELKKDYERLVEKARNNPPKSKNAVNKKTPTKAVSELENSPGTSGFSRTGNLEETVIKMNSNVEDEENCFVNVESSDEEEEPLVKLQTTGKKGLKNDTSENCFANDETTDDEQPLVKHSTKSKRRLRSARAQFDNHFANVETSDDEQSLSKGRTRAKRRLRSASSQSGSRAESDSDYATQLLSSKELKIEVSPCKVKPGTTISIQDLNNNPKNKRKKRPSKISRWSRGNASSKKSKKSRYQKEDVSDGSSSTTETSKSRQYPSYVLSPAIIERIRAPSPLFSKAEEGWSEVSSTFDDGDMSTLNTSCGVKDKNRRKQVGRKVWPSLDLSLLEVVTLSEDYSEGELSPGNELVTSTTTGDPPVATYTHPSITSQRNPSNSPYSWAEVVPAVNTEPEYIDIDTIEQYVTEMNVANLGGNGRTKPYMETSATSTRSQNLPKETECSTTRSQNLPNETACSTTRSQNLPNETACSTTCSLNISQETDCGTKQDSVLDEIFTISSTSSSDTEDDIVFISSEKTSAPKSSTSNQVTPSNGANVNILSPSSILTSKGLRLLPARSTPSLLSTISTSSVMTSKGLKLIRQPSTASATISSSASVNSSESTTISNIARTSITYSSTNQSPGNPGITNEMLSSFTSSIRHSSKRIIPQTLIVNKSHPAQNTQSQQTPVIDLTEEENMAEDDQGSTSSSSQSSSQKSSTGIVPVNIFYNSSSVTSEPDEAESPLKITETKLRSIRTVLVSSRTKEINASESDIEDVLAVSPTTEINLSEHSNNRIPNVRSTNTDGFKQKQNSESDDDLSIIVCDDTQVEQFSRKAKMSLRKK